MTAVLALGGNLPTKLGLPMATIQAAMRELSLRTTEFRAVSHAYLTPAFPAGAGPDFINAAVAVTFDGTAEELLAVCHQVEAIFDRSRQKRWDARTLDVDLLAFGDQVLPDRNTVKSWIDLPEGQRARLAPERLILPHPRLHERAFVLVPMADVAAEWRHPILGLTVSQMLARLPNAEIGAIRRLEQPIWP